MCIRDSRICKGSRSNFLRDWHRLRGVERVVKDDVIVRRGRVRGINLVERILNPTDQSVAVDLGVVA
eukprot:12341515-Prorocentrum_lima.AAC.1